MRYLTTRFALWILWRRARAYDHDQAVRIDALPNKPQYDRTVEMMESASVRLMDNLRYVQKAILK